MRRKEPGQLAFSAFDAAYCMAPYALGPDQALLIEGKFPECRFANVVLWEPLPAELRLRLPADLAESQADAARTRRRLPHARGAQQTRECRTGSTAWAAPAATIYWRFMLPAGDIVTPKAQVVRLSDVRNARG